MKIIIKILCIFILLFAYSFQPAYSLDKSLLEELKKLEETEEKLDIDAEIKELDKIQIEIDKAAKQKREKYLKNGKSLKNNRPEDDSSGEDYEEFLQQLRKDEKIIKKEKSKQENLSKKLQSEQINVVLEINKYFINENLIPVDLEDCLRIAMENNFNIRIFSKIKEQDKWAYRNTFADFLPSIDYQFEISRLNGDFIVGGVVPLYVNESPFFSLFNTEWTFLDGGRRIFKTKAQRSRYKASIKNFEFTKEKTIRDTAISYYTVLGQKLGIEILTRNLKETKAQLELTTQNFDAGIGTKFDVLRAKAEVAQAEQRLLNSYNIFRLEQANLANLLGLSVFSAFLPVENDVDKKELLGKDMTIENISSLAMKARPDLRSLILEVKALKNDRSQIRAGFLPAINGFWSLGHVGTSQDGSGPSNSFGINVKIPFGNGLGINEWTNFNKLDAQISEALLKFENTARDIQKDIVGSYYDSKTAEERIEAAKEEVKAADESLRLAFLRLEAGLGIYVDVLQSQTAKTDAKINLIRAIIDYNIAQINLLFDSGTITTMNILKNYDKTLSQKHILEKQETKGEIELPKDTPKHKLPNYIESK